MTGLQLQQCDFSGAHTCGVATSADTHPTRTDSCVCVCVRVCVRVCCQVAQLGTTPSTKVINTSELTLTISLSFSPSFWLPFQPVPVSPTHIIAVPWNDGFIYYYDVLLLLLLLLLLLVVLALESGDAVASCRWLFIDIPVPEMNSGTFRFSGMFLSSWPGAFLPPLPRSKIGIGRPSPRDIFHAVSFQQNIAAMNRHFPHFSTRASQGKFRKIHSSNWNPEFPNAFQWNPYFKNAPPCYHHPPSPAFDWIDTHSSRNRVTTSNTCQKETCK